MSPQYIVGIDLGTSHTLLAYAPADGSAPVTLLPIAQRVSTAEIAAAPLLPSLRYQAGEGELAPATWQQPWPPLFSSETSPALLGRYAQDLGAQVPGRLVSSAKSWLSHAGVDRSAPILPWGAPEGVAKISPLQASASYLAHLRAAWDAQFPAAPLAQQELVLTVPASFDEGARALTLEAAQLAGLPPLRLLEEPQAALHDWLLMQSAQVGEALQGTEWLLVVDIGGGTTDLSLVQVQATAGLPELARRGVGAHLMLGGDNMDLALAHGLEAEMAAPQPRLSAARFAQLVQRCRVAKEQLLAPDAPEAVTVTLLGSGTQLMGGARSAQLRRESVRQLLLEGFFPLQPADARPQQRQAGLLAWGLPYPFDAAITRHLAAFLGAHAGLLGGRMPDSVLFNGGVFHGTAIAERMVEQLTQWRGAPLRVLINEHPDWAVARGAVAHGLERAQRGRPDAASAPPRGLRIGGGSARSYFLRLDNDDSRLRAICLLPQGSEEGLAQRLAGQRFSLRLGQAVRFHLLASTAPGPVAAGDVRDLAGQELVHLPPLTAVLPAPAGRERAQVEVLLQATMTEVGTLEVQCVAVQDPAQTWPLVFAVRAAAAAAAEPPAPADGGLARAMAQIERVFGSQDQSVTAKEVKQLRSALEKILGARESWDLALLRMLFDALLARARRRRRTPEHERSWLNLAGYCLRPGVGAELDDWRMDQVWALHDQGIAHAQDSGNWAEWWIFWRRAAAGLSEVRQMQLLEDVAGHMQQAGQRTQGKSSALSPALGSYDDMVRLFAVLENVPWAYRLEMGQWMLERLARPGESMQTWWALGRICSRVPQSPAGAHQIIPPEQLDPFLAAVLAQDWRHNDSAMFAAVQMARMTGDRARDLSDAQRAPVIARLAQQRAPANWQAMVASVVELDAAEQRRSFGESLPPGLVLIAG